MGHHVAHVGNDCLFPGVGAAWNYESEVKLLAFDKLAVKIHVLGQVELFYWFLGAENYHARDALAGEHSGGKAHLGLSVHRVLGFEVRPVGGIHEYVVGTSVFAGWLAREFTYPSCAATALRTPPSFF